MVFVFFNYNVSSWSLIENKWCLTQHKHNDFVITLLAEIFPRVRYKWTVHNEFFKGCTRNFISLTNSLFFILGEWLSSFTKYTVVAVQVSSTTMLYYCRYIKNIYFRSSHCGKIKCWYLQLVKTSYLKKILLKPIPTVVLVWSVPSFTFIRSTKLRINFLSNNNFRSRNLKLIENHLMVFIITCSMSIFTCIR